MFSEFWDPDVGRNPKNLLNHVIWRSWEPCFGRDQKIDKETSEVLLLIFPLKPTGCSRWYLSFLQDWWFIVAKIHQTKIWERLGWESTFAVKTKTRHQSWQRYCIWFRIFCNLLGHFYLSPSFNDLEPQVLSSLFPKAMHGPWVQPTPTNQQKSWRRKQPWSRDFSWPSLLLSHSSCIPRPLAVNGWFFWGAQEGWKGVGCFFFSGHVSHGQSLLVCIFWGEQPQAHPHGFVSLSIEVFIPINLRISRDLHIILNTSHSSNTTLGLEVCFCLPSPMFDPSDTTTTYFIWWPLRLVHLSSGWFCWSLDWTPPWPYSLARCTPTNTLMIQECTYDLVWCGFVGNTGKHTLHQANTLYINMLNH